MIVLNIAIILFVIMETANVLILYFAPNSKLGNGVAVFNPWFKAKDDEASELFAKYMANWVAGVKLIFIVLLLVILFVGNDITKLCAVFAMILSIATYYFRLNPIIKKLDAMGEITPKGYSKALFMMITGFMLMFSAAAVIYFFIR
ncbi:MAG: hypothetical protein RR552_03985 [Oscillospiraceae bacterium]